jgi:hypothetical protein
MDVSEMDSQQHIVMAEEGFVLALRQEDEFKTFCESKARMADPETLLLAHLKMGVVRLTLMGAQVHATLAIAKKR